MAQQIPFKPINFLCTRIIAAATPAPTAVQIALTSQYELYNASGSNDIAVGVGITAAIALSNALFPAGTAVGGYVIGPGQRLVVTLGTDVGDNPFFTGLSLAAATLYITPGSFS